MATSGFAGAQLGTAVMWAVVLGAFFKYVLTEGLARWQLVTGETILEGAIRRLRAAFVVPFMIYFVGWSFFVGAALLSACAETTVTLVAGPGHELWWSAGHSVVAVVMVWLGGFRFFERIMAGCVGVMFLAVLITAVLVQPDIGAMARGLLVPSIPMAREGGLAWTIALMGGVGGTLTIVCYGYWIRESKRDGPAHINVCRIDLGVGYVVTALFSLAMIVIADQVQGDLVKRGLIGQIGAELGATLGPVARGVFLAGAWAAVFSSVLGVWQSVPSIFEDVMRQVLGRDRVRSRWWYRGYLLALASVPLVQVGRPFSDLQKWYAVIGACFIPALAIVLLVLMSTRRWMGRYRNHPLASAVLLLAIVFFLVAGYSAITR